MKSSGVFLTSLIIGLVIWSSSAVSLNKVDHLFIIERSKNENYVQYDVGLKANGDLPDSSPVTAYWVLENGRREKLNTLEKKYAYGIASQEKIETNRLRVGLAALKGRDIVVEKIDGSFRAVVTIDGKQSVLEKIYVKSQEKVVGLPKVLYVDLYGKTIQTGLSVKERITPPGSTAQASAREKG